MRSQWQFPPYFQPQPQEHTFAIDRKKIAAIWCLLEKNDLAVYFKGLEEYGHDDLELLISLSYEKPDEAMTYAQLMKPGHLIKCKNLIKIEKSKRDIPRSDSKLTEIVLENKVILNDKKWKYTALGMLCIPPCYQLLWHLNFQLS